MAILLTVFQCDGCTEIASLKSTDDWRDFEEKWLDGFYSQFCPNCRKSPSAQAKVAKDVQIILDLAETFEGDEIINDEFIT